MAKGPNALRCPFQTEILAKLYVSSRSGYHTSFSIIFIAAKKPQNYRIKNKSHVTCESQLSSWWSKSNNKDSSFTSLVILLYTTIGKNIQLKRQCSWCECYWVHEWLRIDSEDTKIVAETARRNGSILTAEWMQMNYVLCGWLNANELCSMWLSLFPSVLAVPRVCFFFLTWFGTKFYEVTKCSPTGDRKWS